MTNTEILDLPIADIEVPADRARDFDQDNAQALATLILTQGLFHPIRVRAVGDRYRLISGLHRLRAHEINGVTTIPATISAADDDDAARLEEVMENLGRGELIALDRCHHLFQLKQAWEASRARPLVEVLAEEGGKSFPTPGQEPEVFGFASAVAENVGLSKRYINMAVKIWTNLTADAVGRLPGTDLARKLTELKALSEQKPQMQRRILDLILGDEHPDITNVGGALAFLDRGTEVSPAEKQFAAINTAFGKLTDDALDMVVQNNADRMIASLKRLGRI
ncbi:ParB/RepB/Spo0J family partition protein [Paenirhodobacter populi]|uniref:Chromosome partitioning protein ParB n=1 Tax=Paenirhodobacter populi TaxID=2306993 RepID=A0A443J1K5_9RHOB|nr:ParB N-terminal domain-containing protein [Sinirhodobacter populi]RWR14226.1 chromosome partitioning protein ParB [Sinirhodobacter populi]